MGWLRNLLAGVAGARTGRHAGAATRWVVVDVETSGLDQSSDTLLSIGAVAVRGEAIDVADSFEVVVRQASASSRSNILLHGIGESAQLAGIDPADACRRFLDYAGGSPLLGFHSGFDRAFLARSTRLYLGLPLNADWIDLAALAPALNPQVKAKALDEWLAHFGIAMDERHDASADAFATAMLFVRLLKQVPPADRQFWHLQKLSLSGRWTGAQ
jgi:DNA polymerase III subunit epsilon